MKYIKIYENKKHDNLEKFRENNPLLFNSKNLPTYNTGDYIIFNESSVLTFDFDICAKIIKSEIGIYAHPSYTFQAISLDDNNFYKITGNETNINRLATLDEIEIYNLKKITRNYNL